MLNESIIIAIILILNIFSILIGYMFGRINNNIYSNNKIIETPSFFNKQKSENKVSIDSTKIVTNINTNGLEKKYTNIGNTKETTENITTSINKLKSMKG